MEVSFSNIPTIVTKGRFGDEKMGEEAEMYIKEEFSTYDWVIEKMITEVGFNFKIINKSDFFVNIYVKNESFGYEVTLLSVASPQLLTSFTTSHIHMQIFHYSIYLHINHYFCIHLRL